MEKVWEGIGYVKILHTIPCHLHHTNKPQTKSRASQILPVNTTGSLFSVANDLLSRVSPPLTVAFVATPIKNRLPPPTDPNSSKMQLCLLRKSHHSWPKWMESSYSAFQQLTLGHFSSLLSYHIFNANVNIYRQQSDKFLFR